MEKLDGIGEIVSWDSPKSVRIDVFRMAMLDAGLDPKTARDVCPANAFRRAVSSMEQNRVIRQVHSNQDSMTFQFTSEHLNGTEYEYAKETVVHLNKKTGKVQCEDPAIELMATKLVEEKTDYRYAADVTRTIKKLFDDHGDLFSLRSAGGVYFVPQKYTGLCDQVESAMKAIGGQLNRWEQGSSSRNTANASNAINDTIANLITEAGNCVDGIEEKDDKAMARHMDRVNIVRLKIESYRDILANHVGGLEKSLSEVNNKLLNSLGLSDPEPAYQENQLSASYSSPSL